MLKKTKQRLVRVAQKPVPAILLALVVSMSNVGVDTSQAAGPQNLSQIGQGFSLTPADLAFILKQIKIAEYHVSHTTAATGLCGALIGVGTGEPPQILSPLLPLGLRTVDGSCNNLQPGRSMSGATSEPFPRLAPANFISAGPVTFDPDGPGPINVGDSTSYLQTSGFVFDADPRMVSNLIVDQTSANPAAVSVAGNPVRAQQGADIVEPCTIEPSAPGAGDGLPAGCTPKYETLFISNITTDVGLSPPFNSLFTIFGQFFDHGVDKRVDSDASGTVFVSLKDDDPLVAGNDHIFGNTDDLPPHKRFMAVTRGRNLPGLDGVIGTEDDIRDTINTNTPFVDQSQTYSSHSTHQVFLRDYVMVAGRPAATGKFLSTATGGIANWEMVKVQAATKLGLKLVDVDVNNIPMVAADLYGNFIPGPNGYAQWVTATGLVEGDPAAEGNTGLSAPLNVKRIDIAFLNDIAHAAAPGNIGSPKTPDSNDTAGGSLDHVNSGEYDDELLGLHYICGDGRCNENIGLTAVHQVFHMEHDRLVDDIKATLNRPENINLKAAYEATTNVIGPDKTFTANERLFQAARFATEMQYQHLVFEEFARKVQPAIVAFEPFAFTQTNLNPAVTAEFAHAVYRFGHSMLDETIPRKNSATAVANGAPEHNDIPLFDGFLNPAAFNDGGNGTVLTDPDAVGAIIMGLSDQTGNEIDEFVTNVLRDHLVGLPLDLAAINMTRARSEGVPSLNKFRRQVFLATNDGQMTPYTNWIDFDQNLKHHESLVNFIAAYGKHPSIKTLDPDGNGPIEAGSIPARRAAANQLVYSIVLPGPDGQLGNNCSSSSPDPECADNIQPPADSADFMFSTGVWTNDNNGNSITGLDDIDLWVGGLAENTNLFGGLLGSTFNYVFEKQLTDLQNGDRFYYLARTPGMNLRGQLEGNSFAEMVLRNTQGVHTLKADAFATADCKFELSLLVSPANPNNVFDPLTEKGNKIFGPGSVDDVLTTECNENLLLIRQAGKTAEGIFKYRAVNQVDPVGINGQSVYNGTDFADEFFGGNDNDTFWGGLGNDIIEGGGGDDVIIGGLGNDIMTDSSGLDIMKGGPGNDAMNGGIGDDLLLGGEGKDFLDGGGNLNAFFAGPGDDFILGGAGIDEIIGESGDDWAEGGDQPDLMIGDSSTLDFTDHDIPGHDILRGQGGDDDYDMEGGDDIGFDDDGIEKVAGASGWDWEIALGKQQPMDADLDLPIIGLPIPLNATRDRFNEVEALSGWNLNDTLRGDSIIPSQRYGGGFIGCDALDADGVARINGLDQLVTPPMMTVDSLPIIASSVTDYCLLEGPVWGEGNILLGGAGSDSIEGRGANDIIDGDRYLNVRLSVRAGVNALGEAEGLEIGSTNVMTGLALTGTFGPGTEGLTLEQAVFAGKVDTGQIVAVREILSPDIPPAAALGDCTAATPVNCDKALFSGSEAEYDIIDNGDGSITVNHARPLVRNVSDGIDTLWNIEQLVFCDVPDAVNRGSCSTRSAPVDVPATFTLTPTLSTLNYQNVLTKLAPASAPVRTFIVTSSGIKSLVMNPVALSGDPSYSLVADTCTPNLVLPRTGTCSFSVRFNPQTPGIKTGTVVFSASNAAGSPVTKTLTGNAQEPVATLLSPTGGTPTLAFGQVDLGTSPSPTSLITLSNTGTGNLSISGIAVSSSAGGGFSRIATSGQAFPDCGPLNQASTLASGASCMITIRFAPTTAGNKTGNVSITSNSQSVPGTVLNVALSGTGTVPSSLSTNSLSFTTQVGGTPDRQVVSVTNLGTANLAINGLSFSNAAFSRATTSLPLDNCGTSLAVGSSCSITVRFAPTTGNGGGGTRNAVMNATCGGVVKSVTLTGNGTITANDDNNTIPRGTLAGTNNGNTGNQTFNFNVRINDLPSAGTVTINSTSFSNGGAAATPSVNSGTGVVSWVLGNGGFTGTSAAAIANRQNARAGTYTVNYTLTNGTASTTANYTMTVQ